MEMQKGRSLLVLVLPILVAVVSLGCGLSGILNREQVQVEPTPTRTPMPTFTPTPANVALVEVRDIQTDGETAGQAATEAEAPPPQPEEPTATATAVVQPTPEPPTPTPDVGVSATVLQNMNVRSGPGTGYPVVAAGTAGETAKVIGRNNDSSWVQVEYPGRGSGWLYASLVQINGDPNTVDVVNVPPPPPPTAPPPTPTPEGPPPTPEPKYQFTPTGWHASHNAAIVHFKGRIRDEQGNLVNGYSILVDNWSWSVISHPSGASHHYPEKGDGEWDVIIPKENIGDGIGWWYLTVVRYECPDFLSRFDAQCKQFTRLSEDVKIQTVWPDETIINADWVCHWDCDKGLYVQGFRR